MLVDTLSGVDQPGCFSGERTRDDHPIDLWQMIGQLRQGNRDPNSLLGSLNGHTDLPEGRYPVDPGQMRLPLRVG